MNDDASSYIKTPIPGRNKSPELLFDLAEHLTDLMTRKGGLPSEKSSALAWDAAQHMAAHWGGQNLYFPIGTSIIQSNRARHIWHEFNGHNHAELARKHNISVQWVYTIIKKMQAEEQALRQQSLFSDANLAAAQATKTPSNNR